MFINQLVNLFDKQRASGSRTAIAHILGAGVTACLVIGCVITSSFFLTATVELGRAEADARDLIRNARKLYSQHQSYVTERVDCERELEERLAAIPNVADASAFLHSITRVFEDSGLKIHDAQPGAHRAKSEFDEVDVVIRAQGSFRSICTALANSSQLAFRCRVCYLSIEGDADGNDALRVEVKMSIPVMFKFEGASA